MLLIMIVSSGRDIKLYSLIIFIHVCDMLISHTRGTLWCWLWRLDTEDLERLLVSQERVWLLRSEEIFPWNGVEDGVDKANVYIDIMLLNFHVSK